MIVVSDSAKYSCNFFYGVLVDVGVRVTCLIEDFRVFPLSSSVFWKSSRRIGINFLVYLVEFSVKTSGLELCLQGLLYYYRSIFLLHMRLSTWYIFMWFLFPWIFYIPTKVCFQYIFTVSSVIIKGRLLFTMCLFSWKKLLIYVF